MAPSVGRSNSLIAEFDAQCQCLTESEVVVPALVAVFPIIQLSIRPSFRPNTRKVFALWRTQEALAAQQSFLAEGFADSRSSNLTTASADDTVTYVLFLRQQRPQTW